MPYIAWWMFRARKGTAMGKWNLLEEEHTDKHFCMIYLAKASLECCYVRVLGQRNTNCTFFILHGRRTVFQMSEKHRLEMYNIDLTTMFPEITY